MSYYVIRIEQRYGWIVSSHEAWSEADAAMRSSARAVSDRYPSAATELMWEIRRGEGQGVGDRVLRASLALADVQP